MSVQNLIPFHTSAVFCSNCGMMLALESHTPVATCRFCRHQTQLRDLVDTEVVTKKELTQRKEWMENSQTEQKKQKVTKVVVEEDCPECDSKQMYYETRQMRSADEGQTVFYECVKCGHKFSVNT
ncbi:hypothetical protein FGO68_gene11530 [Halteria grandinella]|uniref:DNA-directed RNA polymerase subunit n=1 Tax=Halteria grandinella TaxID=5974 RepID=A0A8J8SUD1_HALGN|nr:hypothetical protein FGO68_gene11530 [Halteria grandinella]